MKRGKGWAKDDLEGGSRHSDRKSRTTHTTVPESCTDSEDRPSSRHSSRRSSPSNSSRGDEAIEADSQFRKGRRGVSEHGTKRSCSTSRNRRGDVDEFAPRGSSRKSLSDHGISGISHSGDEPIDDADSRVRKGLRSVSDHGYKRESSISRHEAQPTVAEEQDSPKAKGRRSSSDNKRASSSSRHKSRRGRRHSTSQAEPRENALSPGGRHPSRTGQADADRENTLSPGRHPTRRTLTEKDRQDSRRSMRRQISQQRRNSTLTPKKDKPSTRNQETKRMDIDSSPETEDPHSEVKQRVLHDLAIKKLEIENKQLRDELVHARDIIRQLREQQLEQTTETESDYYSSTRESTITTDLQKKAKKSSRKSSFWSREKAATLVGLDKKKSKAKSDIKEGLLTMSTATAPSSYATPCYSELVSDTPKSSKDDTNNNNSNNSKKPTLAQNVASALEKQMSFRRSITACNSSPLTTSSNHEQRESASRGSSKSMSLGSMEKQASVRRSIVACNSNPLTSPSNHEKRETASRKSRGSKAVSPVDTNKQMSVRHSIVASSSSPLTSSSNHEKRENASRNSAMSPGDMQVLMTQAVSLRHVNTYE